MKTFYSKMTILGVGGGGHEIYKFLFPYSTDATYKTW